MNNKRTVMTISRHGTWPRYVVRLVSLTALSAQRRYHYATVS